MCRSRSRAPRRLVIAALAIDFDTQTVTAGDAEVRLTARETRLLEHLAINHVRPVTREELLVEVWGYNDGSVRTRTVDVHIQQLRAKLAAVEGGDALIETVRGRGYRLIGPIA